MKKIIVVIFLLFLFAGLTHAKTEFIQAPYTYDRLLFDLQKSTLGITINVYQINVGTFVCTSSFTADSGNFLTNLWVRGEAVVTELTVGTTVHGLVFMFDSTQGTFYADQLYWRPTSTEYYKTTQFSFYDGAGRQRTLISPVIAIDSSCYFDFNNQGVGVNDAFIFNTTRLGIGNDIANLRLFISTGGWWNDWNGVPHYFRDGLELGCTIYAPVGRFNEVHVSTLYGTSPIFVPDGFRFADGSVITSTIGTGGFTSSSTARIPTVYVCANDSPPELKAVAQYVCDGTDDEVELQSALDYVNGLGGGKVQLEKGTYYITTTHYIYISSKTTLSGQGWNNTIIQNTGAGGSGQLVILRDGAEHIVIENLKITSDDTNYGYFIYAEGKLNNILIQNCRIAQRDGTGGGAGGTRCITFVTDTTTNVWICNNIFYENQEQAVWIEKGYSYHILNNYFSTLALSYSADKKYIYLLNVRDSVISGNEMYYGKINIYADSNCQNLIISNNISISDTVYPNSTTGFSIDASSSVINGNLSKECDKGFTIGGSYNTITGNSSLNSTTYNASIGGTNRIQEGNSWNANSLFSDGSNAMTGALDMGNNNINNCPVIFNTTTTVQVIISTNAQQQNEIYDLQKSTGGLQFAIGIDSVPAVNDFCGTSTLFNWNLKSLYGFLDTPATGSAFIADCYISNSADVVATIKIDIGCSSTTVVNISSQVPSGYWFKARIKQIGSTVSGSDFRINGEYTK